MKKLWSVLTDDLQHCYVSGNTNIAIHHVFYGQNGNRLRCERYGFLVPLRPDLHNMNKNSLHDNPNKGLDIELKKKAQTYYETHNGSRKDFIREFGKSWL